VFHFDPARARFTLASRHPGQTVEDIRAATGFEYDEPEHVPVTPDPTPEELTLLRGEVRDEMQETYPEFCGRVWPQVPEAPNGRAA
jgi:glutaconate CoA-transferase subunit B